VILTADARTAIREAVDATVRARIDWTAVARCAGCGCELVDDFDRPQYVTGCGTCVDRHWKHRARALQRSNGSRQLVLLTR
jgi:hypothetical protein